MDQCRALIYAVIETKQPQVKRILTFTIWERRDWRHQDFHVENLSNTPMMQQYYFSLITH
ncbi:hypothetical protein SOASR014_39520 [Pectobacterium carotovorum subsp. carotovorum]|nr:hypothetical protein SOASR014_39520 [Pectobacterium carotovorum subsp. carotovorum]GLX43818.1 hypothetical protein Pcaca01_14860 [Pectobacterium carotovorum subsp. carotovorum]